MSILLDWKKYLFLKQDRISFFLPVVLLLSLPHDINAVLISLVEGSSLKFLKVTTFDWGHLISVNPEQLLGLMDSSIICGCTAPAKG